MSDEQTLSGKQKSSAPQANPMWLGRKPGTELKESWRTCDEVGTTTISYEGGDGCEYREVVHLNGRVAWFAIGHRSRRR